MEKIKVELGENSYEIFIGENLLDDVAKFVTAPRFSKKVLIVTDENIFNIYGEELRKIFCKYDTNFEIEIIPAGETSKSLTEVERLYTCAIESQLDRKSVIVAIGGGVVGDLSGFVAATYLRGVSFVQVPTTLLAQVDSSVGGKTAVNHIHGKNLIGAFYQPKAVFIDINTLKNLPVREIRAGLGEIVKYGVISGEDFFSYLEKNVEGILGGNVEVLKQIVKRSCEIKADVVSRDEKESGLRRILNFGHTIAHAVEEQTGYIKYSHGEAVAIGMIGAALISQKLNYVDSEKVARLKNLIEHFGMYTHCEECTVEGVYKALFRDKKTVGGKINWVLMKDFGSVEITDEVPEDVIKAALKEIIQDNKGG